MRSGCRCRVRGTRCRGVDEKRCGGRLGVSICSTVRCRGGGSCERGRGEESRRWSGEERRRHRRVYPEFCGVYRSSSECVRTSRVNGRRQAVVRCSPHLFRSASSPLLPLEPSLDLTSELRALRWSLTEQPSKYVSPSSLNLLPTRFGDRS
jgi:hypothetical protein